MKNCLLPHSVTYYRRVESGEGCAFERHVLDPVRLRMEQEAKEDSGSVSSRAVLYIFQSEFDEAVPAFSAQGDFFVNGICLGDFPPRDGSAYRVTQVSRFDTSRKPFFLRLVGIANRGDWDV